MAKKRAKAGAPRSSASEAKRQLGESCRQLLAAVESQELATPEELEAYKPGGRENPDTGYWGISRYYANLVRFNARGVDSRAPGGSDVDDVDRRFLAAYAQTPKPLQLSNGQTVLVYPKSLGELIDIHQRDLLVTWMLARIHAIEERHASPEELQEYTRGWAQIEKQNALVVWNLTSERIPYDPHSPIEPEIPDYVRAIQPGDYVRILRAHQEVNNARLRGMDLLFDLNEKRGHERPFRWSVFVGTLADKLHLPAGQLMWDWSYAELLGQSAIAASAEREAYETAEREAKRKSRRSRTEDLD